MAVDRGSLRYTIAVEDKFTKPIRKFREELLKAKGTLEAVKQSTAGFARLQTEIGRTTTETRRYRTEQRAQAQEERQQRAEQLRKLRELQAAQKQTAQNEKIRASIFREVRQQELKAQQAAAQAEKDRAKAAKEAEKATKQRERENQKLLKQLGDLNNGANRVAFTFRRLFGILAAFTIAREAIGAFTGLIVSAIQFNRSVEDTQIGLAALFVTLGQVRDAQGQLVEGSDAFKIAQTEARRQTELLRIDALRTVATFEELSRAFQAALAPGLAAGLPLDQIRELTTLISQAAGAFPGLSQDQLPEEIRALLIPGAATSRTSRIFTALDIKPEELKRAKEAGELFTFLQKRLKPFDLAAEATQKTFTGLLARLKDAVGIGAGNASILFFNELKLLLGDIGDAFIEIKRDATGAITSLSPNPRAVQTLAILFDGLREGARTLREGFTSIPIGPLQNAVAFISSAIKGAAEVARGFVTGLVRGLSDVSVLAKRIFGAFESPVLREVVALFTRIAVFSTAISLTLGSVGFALKLILSPLFLIAGGFVKAYKGAALLLGVVKLIPAALTKSVAVIGALVAAFEIAQVAAKKIGESITKPIEDAAEDARFASIGAAIDNVNSELRKLEARKVINPAAEERIKVLKERLKSLQEQAKKSATLVDPSTIPAVPIPVAPELDDSSFTGFLTDLLGDINKTLDGALGGDIVDEKAITDKLKKIEEEIQGTIGKVEQKAQEAQLTEFEKALNEMRDLTQAGISIMTNAVQSFAGFTADLIVDAFDPNNDASLRERFAQFLQGLARQILQTILTLLIATAIAKAFGVPLPSDTTPPPSVPGLAEGGPVPDKPAHGVARPKNLPASDTVPAWLTPGEFVQTTKAVAMYGMEVMEALRRGSIDPGALKALVGSRSGRQARVGVRAVRNSYATGGVVTAASQGLQTAQSSRDSAQQPGVTVAAVVANDRAMERLLGGGKKAVIDFMRENASAINGVLAKDRR